MKYFEIIMGVAEISRQRHLMATIVSELHKEFNNNVKNGKNEVGLSFPSYNASKMYMGDNLRVMSHNEEQLSVIHNNMLKMSDFFPFEVLDVKDVPTNGHYVVYKKMPTHNKNNRIRNYIKKYGINDNFDKFTQDVINARQEYPFLMMKSNTSKNSYPLIIKRMDVKNEMGNNFNGYGFGGNGEFNGTVVEW